MSASVSRSAAAPTPVNYTFNDEGMVISPFCLRLTVYGLRPERLQDLVVKMIKDAMVHVDPHCTSLPEFRINVATDRAGLTFCAAFVFIADERVVNVVAGANPDGSPRAERVLQAKVDEKFSDLQPKASSWAEELEATQPQYEERELPPLVGPYWVTLEADEIEVTNKARHPAKPGTSSYRIAELNLSGWDGTGRFDLQPKRMVLSSQPRCPKDASPHLYDPHVLRSLVPLPDWCSLEEIKQRIGLYWKSGPIQLRQTYHGQLLLSFAEGSYDAYFCLAMILKTVLYPKGGAEPFYLMFGHAMLQSERPSSSERQASQLEDPQEADASPRSAPRFHRGSGPSSSERQRYPPRSEPTSGDKWGASAPRGGDRKDSGRTYRPPSGGARRGYTPAPVATGGKYRGACAASRRDTEGFSTRGRASRY